VSGQGDGRERRSRQRRRTARGAGARGAGGQAGCGKEAVFFFLRRGGINLFGFNWSDVAVCWPSKFIRGDVAQRLNLG